MKIVRYEVSDIDIEPPIIIVYYEDGRMQEMFLRSLCVLNRMGWN